MARLYSERLATASGRAHLHAEGGRDYRGRNVVQAMVCYVCVRFHSRIVPAVARMGPVGLTANSSTEETSTVRMDRARPVVGSRYRIRPFDSPVTRISPCGAKAWLTAGSVRSTGCCARPVAGLQDHRTPAPAGPAPASVVRPG